MRTEIDIINDFIEYATKTKKFHDLAGYEKIKNKLISQRSEIEKLTNELIKGDII